MSHLYKIVIYVPETHADIVREAIGKAGAGRVGDYTYCSFSTKGTGRFLPGEGAHPAIGAIGTPEAVAEERIETVCTEELLPAVLDALKAAHPYEEPATDIYQLVTPA